MKRLNYHHLHIFWIFSKEGAFRKAAEKLSISQSAVSLQIQQLEASLGLRLVDRRNPRRPLLTEEGRLAAEHARAIFERGDELLNWSDAGPDRTRHVLKVGALAGLSRNFQYEFLAPLVRDGDVGLEVTTGDQDKLLRLLMDHRLDVVLSSHNVGSEGRLRSHTRILSSSPLAFVVHRDFYRKGRKLGAYLKDRALVLPGRNFEARPELDAHLAERKLTPKILAEVDDIALLRLFALKSGAVVAIPEMGILNEIKTASLKVIEKARGVEQRFYALTLERKLTHPSLARLIEAMRAP